VSNELITGFIESHKGHNSLMFYNVEQEHFLTVLEIIILKHTMLSRILYNILLEAILQQIVKA
jgi:hypothetical protein